MDTLYYLFFEMEGRGIFYWIATVLLAMVIGSHFEDNPYREEKPKGTGIYILLLIALGFMWASGYQA